MSMAGSLRVRLDQSAEAALDVLRAGGLSDSDAIRIALREAAARRRCRSALQAEAALLSRDGADRAEAESVRIETAELAP